MAEKTIAGLHPRRLSDDEPIDYVPQEHVVTGRAVDSHQKLTEIPVMEGRSAETLAAELVLFAARAAVAETTSNPLQIALLCAARVLIDELRLVIDATVDAHMSTRSEEAPRRRSKKEK